ncbi:hypothetical protein BGX31_005434 [Mortierella sp. GBA43]|nr:hypothetical protein BGX31_005434 [Mortierella sp. GBA43]
MSTRVMEADQHGGGHSHLATTTTTTTTTTMSQHHHSSSTDQDALFELIVQKVPPEKRELLSTTWSRDYLNRLTSLPTSALQSEPEKLREEQAKVERDMSELAFRDYKAFILVKDCKQDVQSTFETLGQHLDTFQEKIPKFSATLTGVSTQVGPILERQHVLTSILATHSQLLEVLEIPLLMETCVRNAYYNEALELASHVQRLVARYPGIGIIREIELKVAQGKEMMLVQLLAQLREPIKLPVALRIIGFLRRIGSFNSQMEWANEDDEATIKKGKVSSTSTVTSQPQPPSSSSSSLLIVEDEMPLKMLFLKSRGLYMTVQLSKVVFHKGDSFGFLKKYIDVTRECLFDIMSYYKSIFGNVDSYTGGTGGLSFSSSFDYKGSGSAADSASQHPQQSSCWTTDNLLADFVASRSKTLLHTLQIHIPQIQDTSALSSILTQLMYFGANMGKIGFDLRYLVTSLFEEAVLRVVGGAFQKGADEFVDSLGGEGKKQPDWQLPSQWMLGGTGRAPMSLSSSSSSSPVIGRTLGTDTTTAATSTSMSPQTCLMDYPPLAYLTNAYLTALNSLRLLAPLSLAIPLREILVDTLIRVDLALEEYDRFIFGERAAAFRSALFAKRQRQRQQDASLQSGEQCSESGVHSVFKAQGMEGSAVLNEQKIMDGFVVVYKHAVQDYILKCFDQGIYGGLIHVEVDVDIDVEADEGLVQDSAHTTDATEVQGQEEQAPEDDGTENATDTPSTKETDSTEASELAGQASDSIDKSSGPTEPSPHPSSPSTEPST